MNDGLRFRNSFNLRIQNIILCIFECQNTCGLRLRKPGCDIGYCAAWPWTHVHCCSQWQIVRHYQSRSVKPWVQRVPKWRRFVAVVVAGCKQDMFHVPWSLPESLFKRNANVSGAPANTVHQLCRLYCNERMAVELPRLRCHVRGVPINHAGAKNCIAEDLGRLFSAATDESCPELSQAFAHLMRHFLLFH